MGEAMTQAVTFPEATADWGLVDAYFVEGEVLSQIQYKVTWNTQEIPFWDNFEGAKACALAINTNKNGNRAKLIYFMREKEVEL